MAARIMDTASPGQILASAETVVPRLNALNAEMGSGCDEDDCEYCPRMTFNIATEASEVVVKHEVTTNVQSITCSLRALPKPEDLPEELIPEPSYSNAEGRTPRRSFASLSSFHQEETLIHSSTSDATTAASSMQVSQNECVDPPINQGQLQCSEQEHLQPIAGVQHVGNHKTPATKWYMKIKPTEMQSSDNRIRPKVLPQELIRRHKRIAFLGIMHDNLSRAFINILNEDPTHRWEQVYVLFPSDLCLRFNLETNYKDRSVEQLIINKQTCRQKLLEILSTVVEDLRFLQYEQMMHCGSYWDWREPGGFIHISPLTWGCNPKTCPAMNYYWNSRVPSPEYQIYREGLEYLLGTAKEFDE